MDFSQITKDLETAVNDVAAKKATLDTASQAHIDAQTAYDVALATAREQHAVFQSFFADILPPVGGRRLSA